MGLPNIGGGGGGGGEYLSGSSYSESGSLGSTPIFGDTPNPRQPLDPKPDGPLAS